VLRKIYETKIAKKLRLGSNFTRAALCSINNAVVIGMIKPKTEVAMLACKLHIGNISNKMQEESLTIEYGRNSKGKEKWRINPQYGQKKCVRC